MITLVAVYAISVSLLVIVIMRAPLRNDLPDSQWDADLTDQLNRHAGQGHHDQASFGSHFPHHSVSPRTSIRDKHLH